MIDQTESEKTALAAAVRKWRAGRPMKEAAEFLGMPWRTLEGIEQGRGFRYPALLKCAMDRNEVQ